MSKIKLMNVSKSYNKGVFVVNDFNLEVEKGEFIVLLGPSGCGKTTTLRMIAGIESITSGSLYIDDKLMNEEAPDSRNLSFVFQNYALFPHLSVYDNIAFELYSKKVDRLEIRKRVEIISKSMGLYKYLTRFPSQLSGGERQRVAISRSLIRDTDIILMDEPLSNLDAKLRVDLRKTIKKLHNDLGKTFIYVTHDQIEALTLATRIVVMNNASIVQIDSPENIYNDPDDLFVAEFIGSTSINIFKCFISPKKYFEILDTELRFEISDRLFNFFMEFSYLNKEVYFCIRSDFVTISNESENSLKIDFKYSELLGSNLLTTFGNDKIEIRAKLLPDTNILDIENLSFDQDKAFIFDIESKKRII